MRDTMSVLVLECALAVVVMACGGGPSEVAVMETPRRCGSKDVSVGERSRQGDTRQGMDRT